MTTEKVLASDGLPARASGEWSREKLVYLERYLAMFTKAMRSKWDTLGYLDLMAGPGRCKVLDTDAEFDGSPLLALKTTPEFDWLVFVEVDLELASALESRVTPQTGRSTVIARSFEDTAVLEAVSARLRGRALTIVFVDNLGLDVPFSVLSSLVKTGPVDLFITFPTSDLFRNGRNVIEGRDRPERWTEFFGTDRWRAVSEELFSRGKTDEALEALIRLYTEQLRAIGHSHVALSHSMKTSKAVPLYRLLISSRSALAEKFFRETHRWYEASGQKPFDFD